MSTSESHSNKKQKRDPTVSTAKKEYLFNEAIAKQVCKGMARNVKLGPWLATSGITLPYYLNLATNLMDKELAPLIVDHMIHAITIILPRCLPSDPNQKLYICGIESAGGILGKDPSHIPWQFLLKPLISQLAASANNARFSLFISQIEFIYVRKARKTTGTKQQLEGIAEITSRTPNSDPATAIWLDDVISTGQSFVEGVHLLKSDYNIEVKAGLFLCDRSEDRKDRSEQPLLDPLVEDVEMISLFDLEQIHSYVQTN